MPSLMNTWDTCLPEGGGGRAFWEQEQQVQRIPGARYPVLRAWLGEGVGLCVCAAHGAGRSGPHTGCGAGGQRSLKRGGMIFGTGKNRFVCLFSRVVGEEVRELSLGYFVWFLFF